MKDAEKKGRGLEQKKYEGTRSFTSAPSAKAGGVIDDAERAKKTPVRDVGARRKKCQEKPRTKPSIWVQNDEEG